jgi:hypothetical protein
MASSRTPWIAALLAWMEEVGASFEWIAPAHWSC